MSVTTTGRPEPLLNYDREYDILTIHFLGKAVPSYGQDMQEWLQLFRSLETGEYVALSVWDFSRRYRSGQLAGLTLPVSLGLPWDRIAARVLL